MSNSFKKKLTPTILFVPSSDKMNPNPSAPGPTRLLTVQIKHRIIITYYLSHAIFC